MAQMSRLGDAGAAHSLPICTLHTGTGPVLQRMNLRLRDGDVLQLHKVTEPGLFVISLCPCPPTLPPALWNLASV